jgi:O-antigen ligase
MPNLEKTLKYSLKLLLFLLPFPAIFIYKEQFLNSVKWEYGTLGFFGTEILLWITFFIFAFWFRERIKIRNQKSKINFSWSRDRMFVLFALLFIIYILLSSVWSIDSSVALQQGLYIIGALLLFFMLIIGPLKFREIATWFIAGTVLQSVLGIYQFLFQSTFAFKYLGLVHHPVWQAGTSIISSPDIGRWLRSYGAFSHPNIFGGYLVLSIFISILFKKLNKKNNLKFKIIFFAIYSLQLTALFFTFSRSAWLAFILLFLFIIIFYFKKYFQINLIIINTVILLTALSIIFFPLIQTRFSHQSTNEVRSTTERVVGVGEAYELFKQNYLFGVGIGNYTAVAYMLNPNNPGWLYQPVHNVFILILVELGIIGVILLLSTLMLFIRFAFFINNDLFNILIFSLIICLVLAMFDHYLFSSYIGVMMISVCFGSVFRAFSKK